MEKFKPQDIIAVITILGGFTLLFLGKDGIIATMLLAVTSFYFGLKTEEPKNPGV